MLRKVQVDAAVPGRRLPAYTGYDIAISRYRDILAYDIVIRFFLTIRALLVSLEANIIGYWILGAVLGIILTLYSSTASGGQTVLPVGHMKHLLSL